MKKNLLTAIACFLCMANPAGATETQNDNTGKTPAAITISIDNNANDQGPSVARGVIAQDLGNSSIKIDVYFTSNMCNSYTAYLSGQNTNPMAVFPNEEYIEKQRTNNLRIRCKYYIIYRGSRYYFNL